MAPMVIDALVVWNRTFTIVVTTTIRADLAGAGWADASGAEARPNASSTGTLVCRGPSTT